MPSLYVSPEPAAGSLGPTIFICVVVALAAALSCLKKKRHLEDKHSSVKESASSSSHGSWTRPPKSPLGQRSITAARDLAVLRPPIMQMSPPSPPSPQFLATQFSPLAKQVLVAQHRRNMQMHIKERVTITSRRRAAALDRAPAAPESSKDDRFECHKFVPLTEYTPAETPGWRGRVALWLEGAHGSLFLLNHALLVLGICKVCVACWEGTTERA